MDNLWKVETHAHTSPVSPCAHLSPEEMVREVKSQGYDAVIVTNHYTPDFFAEGDYKIRLKEYYADAARAKAEGDKIGLAVFAAAEVRIPAGWEDYLVFGVDENEMAALGNLSALTLPELYEKVHTTPHGILLQAHPFRGYCKVQNWHYLDGVEVINNNPRHDSHNDAAIAFAKEHRLLYTAGTDVHQTGDAGFSGVHCPPFADIHEFAELIKAKKFEVFGLIESLKK